MRSRPFVASRALSAGVFGVMFSVAIASPARAEEGDPNKGNFTIAEATKGISGPASAPLQATIETSKGKFTCELYDKQAPNTVANFIGLATGKRAWLDEKTNKWVKKPFYNGLKFHRVIPKFMIQGGDPRGNGTGNPGYAFNDEISPDLKFDKPGLLAMANAGKKPDGSGTNGSQFFITEGMPSYLNGRHTIFGACEPVSLVSDIANVKRDPSNDKPVDDVVIKKITFARKAAKGAAKAAAPKEKEAPKEAAEKPATP